MGNICELFSFNKECIKECNTTNNEIKKKNNNTNHVPFLDISNIYYDEDAEPPSYSQLRDIKKGEYVGYSE
jgi:glutamate formiminotransferase